VSGKRLEEQKVKQSARLAKAVKPQPLEIADHDDY
jgi:hypothetical protein